MESWNALIWQHYRSADLTRAYKDVLLQLPKFRGRGGHIFPSHATIAARALCCIRTVQRAMDAAARIGLLSWARRRRRIGPATQRDSNLYLLKNPGKPSTGQDARVASQKNPFLLTAPRIGATESADRSDSLPAIARVAAARQARLGLGGPVAQNCAKVGRQF